MTCSPPGSPSHPPAPPFLLAPLSFQSNSIFSTSLQHWLNLPQLVLTPCQAIFVCHLCFANTVHTYPREILETDDREYLSISSSETYLHIQVCKCIQTCRVLIHIVCLCIHTSMPIHTSPHPNSHAQAHTAHTLQFTNHFPVSSYTPLYGRTYYDLHFAHGKTEAQNEFKKITRPL